MLYITQLRIKLTDSMGLKLFLLYCVLKNGVSVVLSQFQNGQTAEGTDI